MRRVHCCVVDGDMAIAPLFLLLMPLQAALNGFEQRGGDGLLRALFRDQQQAGDVRRDAGRPRNVKTAKATRTSVTSIAR